MAHINMASAIPNVPELDMNRWMEEVSNQMARSKLARRHSNRSSTISSTSWRRNTGRSMRVVKATSAGSSPRGQAYKNPTSFGHVRQSLPEDAMITQEHAGANYSKSFTPSRMPCRPTSWHPSSRFVEGVPAPERMDPAQYRSTMFAGSIEPYSYPSSNEVPMPAWNPYSEDFSASFSPSSPTDPFDSYQPTLFESYNFDLPATTFPDYTPWSHLNRGPSYVDDRCVPSEHLAAELQSGHLSHLGHWPCPPSSTIPMPQSMAPVTDSFLPIQHPDPYYGNDETPAPLRSNESKGNGKELVGMGLYDDLEQKSTADFQLARYKSQMLSSLPGHAPPAFEESAGKGLKLEETWKPPPPPAADAQKDETYSSEGSEADSEGIEILQQNHSQPMIETSFFFDDGDGFFEDSLLPTGSALMASKAQDANLDTFAWI
ncbi:MAG: hypothetical protein M1837_003346 [Sclerophora amabilis]|nr:MAG: hypothetical protein M1837_003346 [Sclerophora amabilis]